MGLWLLIGEIAVSPRVAIPSRMEHVTMVPRILLICSALATQHSQYSNAPVPLNELGLFRSLKVGRGKCRPRTRLLKVGRGKCRPRTRLLKVGRGKCRPRTRLFLMSEFTVKSTESLLFGPFKDKILDFQSL